MFASGGTKGLTGYDSERLVDGTVTLGGDIIHDGDADDVWNAVQDAMDRGEDFDIRYRIRTADGDVLRVREQGRGRYNDGGDVVAVEGTSGIRIHQAQRRFGPRRPTRKQRHLWIDVSLRKRDCLGIYTDR